MPIIKPADLISLFGERTLYNLPYYKRTGLHESDDGTIVKAVYTAEIVTGNWKQKYKDELEEIFTVITGNGIERTNISPVFTSTIEIEMVESDEKYSLTAHISDYDTPDYPFTHLYLTFNRGDAGAIAEQITFAKNKLKTANSPGRIARRILKNINAIQTCNMNVLEKLPSLFRHPEGAVVIGNSITLGRIPDDYKCVSARGMGIPWKVLDIDYENRRALVISENILFYMGHTASVAGYDYSWKESAINEYLNSGFIKEFGLEHVPMVSVEHSTDFPIPSVLTVSECHNSGMLTDEKVFLLSMEEVKKYMPSDFERTAYGFYTSGSSYSHPDVLSENWWLRDPGRFREHYACHIDLQGRPSPGGGSAACRQGVRPAFWINLN